MKKITSFLVSAAALFLAAGVFSCGQQENAPTSSFTPDVGALSKLGKSYLIDGSSGTVVGSATFTAGTGQLKISVTLTDAIPSTTFYVSYNYASCAFNSGNIDTITTDAHGRARFTEILSGTGTGTDSFSLELNNGVSTDYLSGCVTVTIK